MPITYGILAKLLTHIKRHKTHGTKPNSDTALAVITVKIFAFAKAME